MHNLRRPAALLLAVTLVAGLGACGDATQPIEPAPPIATVTVTAGTTVLAPGQSAQLTATASRADGQVVSDAAFTWLSETPAVATVSATGSVTAVSPGTAVIAANAGTVRGTVTLTVRVEPVAVLVLTPGTAADVFIGSTLAISAQALDSANRALVGRTITWTSGNVAVATVSSAGAVTGTGPGSATITATSEGRSASVVVTVTPRPFASIIDSVRLAWNMPAMGGAIVTLESGVSAIGAAGTRRATGGDAVTTSDRWHIGSNVKAMTSLLAAVAVSQGRIQWTTTIAQAFPELGGGIAEVYRDVTLRDLLSHQSGILRTPGQEPLAAGNTAPAQRAAIVPWAVQQEPAAARGTFHYSNVAYVIAAAMLERAFGTSYEEAMAVHLFGPLGMTDAGWGPQAAAGSTSQPVAHTWVNGAWLAREGYDSPPGSAGAGRAHMSLVSWARFLREMLRVEAGTATVADPDVARQTTTQAVTTAGLGYGLGWYLSDAGWANGKVVYHDGTNTANESLAYLAPMRNVAFLVTTNGFDAGGRSTEALKSLIFRMATYHDTGR